MKELERIADLILKEAKALGAYDAQCAVEESEKREFNIDGGEFSLMRTLYDRSISIAVIKDRRKGTLKINRFDDDSVRAAVADCIAAAESAEPDDAWQFAAGPRDDSFSDGAIECDIEALFARTKELMDDIAVRHPKIMVEQLIADHNVNRTVYKNSNGVVVRSTAGRYCFWFMYSAHEGEKGTSFYFGNMTLASLDRPVIDCAFIDRELSAIEAQLDTTPLSGKFTGTAVLAPYALNEIIIGTVMDNFVSDISLIDGTSIWKDKLGESVAGTELTLSFTPRSDDVVTGERVTSEGYSAENYDLIRDGRLVSFALTQYGANKTGGRRAPCGGENPSIPAGDKSLDEIISGIERGALIMRFSGGQPASSGEFSGVAKNSFLIENGKIAGALTETMISGCVPDMLQNIRAVSSDILKDGNLSLPYIAFDGVTISGK